MRRSSRLRMRRIVGNEAGQALVEFAFVMLMMIILILGLVDFARVFLQYQVLTNTAREAARRAVLPNEQRDSIFAGIVASLQTAGIDVTGAQGPETACPDGPLPTVSVVSVYECNWDGQKADTVWVGIAMPYEFAIVGPLIGWATGDRTITLRTSFKMRHE